MHVTMNNNSPIYVDQRNIGAGRREAVHDSGRSTASTNATQLLSQAANDSALRVDNSVHEFSGLVKDFFFQLGGMAGFTDGIINGMSHFEQLHADIMNNFEGEELERRIAALGEAFKNVGEAHARRISFQIQMSSPSFQRGNEALTSSESETAERLGRAANDLRLQMNDMFRHAMDFFRANGSFAGFMDTAAANRHGALSLRDVDIISRQLLDSSQESAGRSNINSINTSELSNSGREFLNDQFHIG